MIPSGKLVHVCALVMSLTLQSFSFAENGVAAPADGADARPSESSIAAYRAMAATQSRNYDQAQDISPRQMVSLLEVSERTGANLGQALATGEFESAHTWNNFVRPLLGNGKLGVATGVWQFQPATFRAIIKRYGREMLTASEADSAIGRQHLDLGAGPFTDTKVRRLIRETVEGARGVDDEELQLLRHNFTVLALAKHYLSIDSGAETPEEDALYHLLGASLAQRVLRVARGDARDTLCVKPGEDEPPFLGADQEPVEELDVAVTMDARAKQRVIVTLMPRSAVYTPPAADALPPVSSAWGLDADSPVVLGNPGIFYRDGNGRTQPYTWAELMKHFARRVNAKRQPALVRAKYGVGFELSGGDVPERAFNPKKAEKVAKYHYSSLGDALVPESLLLGPLDREETRWYRQRLADLVSRGEDTPVGILPPEALSALSNLGMLPPNVREARTDNREVRRALHDFRRKVGKDEPVNPEHGDLLLPAERVALQIYDQRLARYAALQASQHGSLARSPDLKRIRNMPERRQRLAAHYVAQLQEALGAQGLLKQPTKKTVWRDRKRRKRVKYKTLPFAGKVGKKTVAAFRAFQIHHGLRDTDGALDSVSLRLLGLAPMGCEILLPPAGPQCTIDGTRKPASTCEIPVERKRCLQSELGPVEQRTRQSLLAKIVDADCQRHPRVGPGTVSLCTTGQ